MIFLADSGRRTQAMNLDGRRAGVAWGYMGVEVPEVDIGVDGIDFKSSKDDRMPDKIAIPIVPGHFVSKAQDKSLFRDCDNCS